MVGHLITTKPSRSDEVLDAYEQIRITNQIKAQFDALTPKRPIKPNRSEPETQDPVNLSTLSSHNIPELEKLQSLQSNSQGFSSSQGVVDGQDEFVETQYYKELLSINKQHHATGSGFIKAVREGGESGYEIQLPVSHVDVGETQIRGYKSNPATNDWVPNLDQQHHQDFISLKPNRSESS
ncbi:uncharacterized protein LOC131652229 isoform X1 [Vicia villosa]|uniref:uncharacterized protein LOC131652229 isoform X1 n=1 Tax=Vicia villosa TaxID=3911 RepID=UPI00273C9408|nr:uncharacterized protein LOC131652229 isoform X1 [Vicia villosa]